MAETTTEDPLLAKLREYVGKPAGPLVRGRDPVNLPMINHWLDATGDANPLHTDEQVAREQGHPDGVAPPTMLSIWVRDAQTVEERENAQREMMDLLDGEGFASVVATNSTETYERYLVPGETLLAEHTIAGVSERKRTGLGEGYFIDRRTTLRTTEGEVVGAIDFRVLKFRPARGAGSTTDDDAGERPLRPRPAINDDTRFFWEGLKESRLLVQGCGSCGALRHPPGPGCPRCGSPDVEVREMSGRGTVYTMAVVHRPQIPAFDYPLPIVLVELEEGPRLVANVVDVTAEELEIGMPVEVVFREVDDELTLPMFRPTERTS